MQIHATRTAPASVEESDKLRRFSSLRRLLRVTAWCRQWLPHGPTVGPELTANELEEARLIWIRQVQASYYKANLKALQQHLLLPTSSSLLRLSSFLDSQGLLRVGGQLKHSLLAYNERHPIILPNNSHLTRLMIKSSHRCSLHGGVQMTFGAVRQCYWIPRGRAVVKL